MILNMEFSELSQKFNTDFQTLSCEYSMDFKEVQHITKYVGAKYEGEYEITPRTDEQTIPTKEKVLSEDVVIKAIPFFKVTNLAGGNTVFIANEV